MFLFDQGYQGIWTWGSEAEEDILERLDENPNTNNAAAETCKGHDTHLCCYPQDIIWFVFYHLWGKDADSEVSTGLLTILALTAYS